MKILRTLFLALVAVSFAAQANAGEQNLTVVELYTSEGCSSCPPADNFVGELSKRDDVLALSLHVDYWDYIGWKDRFADPRYTLRQRQYAKQFQLRYVYTPQVVVDGAFEAVGSDRDKIRSILRKASLVQKVPVKLSGTANGMVLDLAAADVGDVKVYSVFYTRHQETQVKRGENSGRRLGHSNVVNDMTHIATWDGKATKFTIPASTKGGEVCAVILQSVQTGRIIGAGRLALDGQS